MKTEAATTTDEATAAGLPGYDHRHGMEPTLVLLHYWGGSARTWDAFADLLPSRDVLAIDTRGWGRSAALDGPDDVLAALQDADVQEFVLVGHSLGGKVARLVAARHPHGLRGLVLIPATELSPALRAQVEHDQVEPVAVQRDHLLNALTDAELVVLTRTGHPIPIEARRRFADAVTALVDVVLRRP